MKINYLNLRSLRENKGLAQRELADKCKVARTTFNAWENGQRYPSLNELLKIVYNLNLGSEALINFNIISDEELKKNPSIKKYLQRNGYSPGILSLITSFVFKGYRLMERINNKPQHKLIDYIKTAENWIDRFNNCCSNHIENSFNNELIKVKLEKLYEEITKYFQNLPSNLTLEDRIKSKLKLANNNYLLIRGEIPSKKFSENNNDPSVLFDDIKHELENNNYITEPEEDDPSIKFALGLIRKKLVQLNENDRIEVCNDILELIDKKFV